jgi:hypothetical protein
MPVTIVNVLIVKPIKPKEIVVAKISGQPSVIYSININRYNNDK